MAFKREKTIAAAQKNVRKGNWDRAIKEYLFVLEHDPNDERTRLKVADLYVKSGALDDALTEYRTVANQYAKDDFNEKAVAVFKQALRIAPEDPELHFRIGEGYFRLGRAKDALKSFAKAERSFKETNVVKHREVLERMVELDVQNVGIQIQLAERLEKDGARPESLERFRQAATILREEGRLDEYVQVAERMIFLSPDMYDLRKEVVRIYLGRSDNKRALKHLQVCFRKLPQDIETLELLGTTFHRLGNNDRALLVYIELAQIYRGSGQEQRALEAYRTILSFDPHNREALAAINQNRPAARPKTPPPTPQLSKPKVPEKADALDGVLFLDDDDDGSEVFLNEPTASSKANDFLAFAEDAMREFEDIDLSNINEIPTKVDQPVVANEFESMPSPVPQPKDTQSEFDRPTTDVSEDKLEQYLNESDVFLKYGLLDRAEDVITKVLKIDPNNEFGREQMRKLLEQQGDPRGAAHQLVEIARIRINEGNRQGASESLQSAAMLTGDKNLVKSMAGSVGLEIKDDGSVQLVDISTSFIQKVNLGLDEISSSMFDFEIDVDPATTGSSEIDYGAAKAATTPDMNVIELDFIDSELEIDSIAFDDGSMKAVGEPTDPVGFGFNSEVTNQMFDGLFEGSPSEPQLLTEVDFYLEQGLVSEAEDALAKVAAHTPNHPGISERRGQIDVFRGGGNPFGAGSLTKAFQAVSTIAGESTSHVEFQNTHIELGTTYYEMGLFSEAIEEFKNALEDNSVTALASYQIALCEIELGNATDAKSKLRALMNDQSAPPQLRLSAGEKLAEI